MAAADGYLLGNRQDGAGVRLVALSSLFDPWTFRHLERLGIAPGWRCWEVGAGGPSVASWLADRVGPTGSVLATDVDVSRLEDQVDAPFRVLCHDVGRDAPPEGPFDLVHARLVLVHVGGRDRALAAMADTLGPGGWLLVEDADPELQPLASLEETGPEELLANRIRRGFRTLLAERGADLRFGRTLPRALRAARLVEVEADAFFPVVSSAGRELERVTVEQVRDRLVDRGLATGQEIERHLGNLASGAIDVATAPLISAWGRRPA